MYANGTPASGLPIVGQWVRSTRSIGGNCVEVAPVTDGTVGVRNSRDPNSPALVYTRDEWAAFVEGVKAGEFDDFTR